MCKRHVKITRASAPAAAALKKKSVTTKMTMQTLPKNFAGKMGAPSRTVLKRTKNSRKKNKQKPISGRYKETNPPAKNFFNNSIHCGAYEKKKKRKAAAAWAFHVQGVGRSIENEQVVVAVGVESTPDKAGATQRN